MSLCTKVKQSENKILLYLSESKSDFFLKRQTQALKYKRRTSEVSLICAKETEVL